MIAIFTQKGETRVQMIHYRLHSLPGEPDALVESIPDPPAVDDDHEAELHLVDGELQYVTSERTFMPEELHERAVEFALHIFVASLLRKGQLSDGDIRKLAPLFPEIRKGGVAGKWYCRDGAVYECLASTSEDPPGDGWRRYG